MTSKRECAAPVPRVAQHLTSRRLQTIVSTVFRGVWYISNIMCCFLQQQDAAFDHDDDECLRLLDALLEPLQIVTAASYKNSCEMKYVRMSWNDCLQMAQKLGCSWSNFASNLRIWNGPQRSLKQPWRLRVSQGSSGPTKRPNSGNEFVATSTFQMDRHYRTQSLRWTGRLRAGMCRGPRGQNLLETCQTTMNYQPSPMANVWIILQSEVVNPW